MGRRQWETWQREEYVRMNGSEKWTGVQGLREIISGKGEMDGEKEGMAGSDRRSTGRGECMGMCLKGG